MQASGVASGVYAATEMTNYTTTEFVVGGARGDGATDICVNFTKGEWDDAVKRCSKRKDGFVIHMISLL